MATSSAVHICERCDSWSVGKAIGHIEYRTSPDSPYANAEICPGCVGDFMEWLNDPIVSHREKGYKHPWTPEDTPETGEILARKNMRTFIKELMTSEDDTP